MSPATPADLAEQRGAALGIKVLDQFLAADNQGQRLQILRGALRELNGEQADAGRFVNGFCTVVLNPLEKGLGVSK